MAIMTLSILIIHVYNIIIILIASHLIDYTQITPHTIHITPNIYFYNSNSFHHYFHAS